MTRRLLDGLRRGYDVLEESMGMLLPVLVGASLLPDLISLQNVALAALWMGWGHTLLFYCGLYPKRRWRPFFKGLMACAAGIGWPLWFLPAAPIRR